MARYAWLQQAMPDPYQGWPEDEDNFIRTTEKLQALPAGSHVCVWTCENASEQTMLSYIAYLLRDKRSDISVVNTAHAYQQLFARPNIQYEVLHTGELPPEKLEVIYESGCGTCLSDHEREHLEQGWLQLAATPEPLRIWRNGRIHSLPEDYYDPYMIKHAKRLGNKREFMKASRIIGEVLGHLDQYLGNAFLEYRLRSLVQQGVFEAEGSLAAMRLYRVKLR